MKILRLTLLPLSFVYNLVTTIRNFLYDKNILQSKTYPKPIICVGNLNVGGTGKTPHIEYLVKLLNNRYKIAVLSRGYKRKTKGFILADKNKSHQEIGDEPFQIKNKFSNIIVAVCENRVKGIDTLLELHPEIDVILLDDAFQHRKIKAGLNILITDYHNLYTRDYLLPAGNLRESRYGAKRANIIIISKTPKQFSSVFTKEIIKEINPQPHQSVLFSYIKYSKPIPFPSTKKQSDIKKIQAILLVTGIANPYHLLERLKKFPFKIHILKFSDHHNYSYQDILKIKKIFTNIAVNNKIILTTEKDYVKMMHPDLKNIISELPFYYIKIEIDFHKNCKEEFNKKIIEYVR